MPKIIPIKAAQAAKKPASKKQMSWPVFTERFGTTIKQAGVTPVPRVLLTNLAKLKIKPIHAIILLQMIACWGNNGPHPFPSRGRLRKWIGCDKRTLDRAITQLVRLKLVEKRHRVRDKSRRQTSNEYNLTGLIDRLKPLARLAINEKQRRDKLQLAMAE